MTATQQDFLEQQRAARAAEQEKCEAEKRQAARRRELQATDRFTKADFEELHDCLLKHLKPDKSIYFKIALRWMHDQPQLSFAELPNLNRHLAEAYPLWRFEQVDRWWFWGHDFKLYCCSRINYPHCITIKATPI